MFIVTGGAGFIGSALVWKLNEHGIDDILIVDRMGSGHKWKNLNKRKFTQIIHKDHLFDWLEGDGSRAHIEGVFHLGASSSTTETDVDYLVANNINYSAKLWDYCANYSIPYIYASSAATYGAGEQFGERGSYKDDPALIDQLRPLNPYGFSKQKFDSWVLRQSSTPSFWAGLKFFNVYGPQEYHKAGQSSVVFQFLPQVQQTGSIKLFKSYKDAYGHGEQARDFVYVKDCANIMWHLYQKRAHAKPGIYNVGTGEARTFADLARATFDAMNVNPARLEWVEMPEALRNQYQYFTQADLTRLREQTAYTEPMTSIEEGVRDYLGRYLLTNDPYL